MYFKDLATQHWVKRSDIPAGKRLFEVTIRNNGRTRQAISDLRLRSGIGFGRGTEASHQSGFFSGYLSEIACLRHSFYDRLNVPQFAPKVNPPTLNQPDLF